MKIDRKEHGYFYSASGQEIMITEQMINQCLSDFEYESGLVPSQDCLHLATTNPKSNDSSHDDLDSSF